MKKLNWPTNTERHSYMRMRTEQNRARGLTKAELWMQRHLLETGHTWKPQAMWGYRIFDFWCHRLGTAVEVDGKEHIKDYDKYRDEYNFRRSGIVVLRVRNFHDADKDSALVKIAALGDWRSRKKSLGIAGKTKAQRRSLASQAFIESKLDEYVATLTPLS